MLSVISALSSPIPMFSVISDIFRRFPFFPTYSDVSVISDVFRFSPPSVSFVLPSSVSITYLGSGRDELDHQTELSTRPDYVLPFYCLYLRIISVHLLIPVFIVYLRISPLGSPYCSLPYISLYKLYLFSSL